MLKRIFPINHFEHFQRLYKVFEEPPYNELFTLDEVKEIYDELIRDGYIFGCFVDGMPVGCIAFRKIIHGEHPVHYGLHEKVAYFAELIVLPEFRNNGIGTMLICHMLEVLKNEGYTKVYMRTLQPEQSMSYSIAVKCGFVLLDGVVQMVKGQRTLETRDEVDDRIFLEKSI